MQARSRLPTRRTNRERTEATREALIAAGRALFIERGYAETSTPEIADRAEVTRGALYHHFADKRELFRAIVAAECQAVGRDIEAAAAPSPDAATALASGAVAYLDAMTVPGRTRLLLIDGPAVLGQAEMAALDAENAESSLTAGLTAAMAGQADPALPPEMGALLLSAAFDRAALAIESGGDRVAITAAMVRILERVVGVRD